MSCFTNSSNIDTLATSDGADSGMMASSTRRSGQGPSSCRFLKSGRTCTSLRRRASSTSALQARRLPGSAPACCRLCLDLIYICCQSIFARCGLLQPLCYALVPCLVASLLR